MSKFDWESLNKKKPKGFYIPPSRYRDPFKKRMADALKKYGWQKCPRCGGGRHPSFKLCKKCRIQNKKSYKS